MYIHALINTSLHSSTDLTSFQVVYGRPLPMISSYYLEAPKLAAIDSDLKTCEEILTLLHDNLKQANFE